MRIPTLVRPSLNIERAHNYSPQITLIQTHRRVSLQHGLFSSKIFTIGLLELTHEGMINTFRPTQDGRHFPDDIFKCIFLNENDRIPIKISLGFVPKGPINNIPSLVQIMAWRRPGDKPLSDPMLVRLLMHICITRPQ